MSLIFFFVRVSWPRQIHSPIPLNAATLAARTDAVKKRNREGIVLKELGMNKSSMPDEKKDVEFIPNAHVPGHTLRPCDSAFLVVFSIGMKGPHVPYQRNPPEKYRCY
jgi:hypothetical protein